MTGSESGTAGQGSEAQAEANGAQQQGERPVAEGGRPETFEGWLGQQEGGVKALIDGHVSGLKSALEAERADRKEVARQLAALKGEGDAAALKSQVAQLQATLGEQTGRSEFAEQAVSQGVTNIRLAYLAAKEALRGPHTARRSVTSEQPCSIPLLTCCLPSNCDRVHS